MKKTWLMSTYVTALSFTASGEVNVYPQGPVVEVVDHLGSSTQPLHLKPLSTTATPFGSSMLHK